MFTKHNAPNRCEQSIEVYENGGPMGSFFVGGGGGCCQGVYERKRGIEIVVKIKKNRKKGVRSGWM